MAKKDSKFTLKLNYNKLGYSFRSFVYGRQQKCKLRIDFRTRTIWIVDAKTHYPIKIIVTEPLVLLIFQKRAKKELMKFLGHTFPKQKRPERKGIRIGDYKKNEK